MSQPLANVLVLVLVLLVLWVLVRRERKGNELAKKGVGEPCIHDKLKRLCLICRPKLGWFSLFGLFRRRSVEEELPDENEDDEQSSDESGGSASGTGDSNQK